MTARAAVVLVTYNSAEHIENCLSPLNKIASAIEVVIVDNDSRDNTVAIAQKACLAPRVIQNTTNTGFAIAVNQAVASTSAPVVVLLNPDCIIDSVSLLALIDRLDADPTIGVIAPTIVHPDGRLAARSAGYQPSFTRMASHALGLPRLPLIGRLARGFNLFPAGETPPDTDVEWVSGACFAVRRSTWDRLGGLSERWFMYAEDLDFCRRISETGMRIVHTSRGHATHVVGASSDSGSGPIWTLWIENLADYYRLEFKPSRFTFASWKLVTASIYASRGALYQFRSYLPGRPDAGWRREADKFFAYARAVLTV